MVKVCCVKNCLSGRKVDRSKRKKLNLRQISLFKAPKCSIRLDKWSSALSQSISDDQYVCELHFNNADVIKEDSIKLSDGNVYISHRVKFDLKFGAVPVSINSSTDENRQTLNEDQQSTLVNSINNQDCVNNVNSVYSVSNVNSEEMVIDELFKCSIKNDDINYEQLTSEKVEIDEEIYNSINTFHENSINNIETQEQIIVNNLNINPEKPSKAFTLNTIINILQNEALPQNWSWSIPFGNNTNVCLYYIDSVLKKLKLEIVISEEFTIMINIIETGISITYNHSMSSIHDLRSFFSIIKKSQFCNGPGFNNARCSTKCYGILPVHQEYKRYKSEKRCKHCQEIRKKILNSQKKNKSNINKRFLIAKRKLHSKSKQLHRLQRKNEELKEGMEDLRKLCAKRKEKILEDEISNLPDAQKEAVRACFEAAKVQNSKQRRYTVEWVYEYLMIRIKGPGVYEKLRTRQVLPLPSKDTLNKYINKLDSAFGFPKAIFDTLRLKASRMEQCCKRGINYLLNRITKFCDTNAF